MSFFDPCKSLCALRCRILYCISLVYLYFPFTSFPSTRSPNVTFGLHLRLPPRYLSSELIFTLFTVNMARHNCNCKPTLLQCDDRTSEPVGTCRFRNLSQA